MGTVIADRSVSLDGFGAGPDVGTGDGMGDGGEGLHTWISSEGGRTGRDGAAIEGPQELIAGAGAVVVGRRRFDLGEEPWGDPPPFPDEAVPRPTCAPGATTAISVHVYGTDATRAGSSVRREQ
jgi:hypothetical protein